MDLNSVLEAIAAEHPEAFSHDDIPEPSGDWTDAKLRTFLDSNGIKYEVRSKFNRKQYDLAVCPLCSHSEGNPAVWLHNGHACFKCFWAGPGCDDVPKKTFADLQAHFQRPKLARINAGELVTKHLRPRQHVIPNLIRHGDVVNIIGGPKARKSFLVMQLALSIASGSPFLAWQTVPGRVLLIDNELRGDDLASRLTNMAKAMGLDWEQASRNIDIMPLRGKLADLTSIRDELCNLPANTYSLVVLDALYKALPANVDENSNSNITQMYVMLDEAAEKHNCATVVVHHTSKGSQHQKSVSDMGSGAGAQSRSADVHIVLREHEEPGTVVLHAIVRSQKPVEPMCLTFDYPLWQHAPEKNPHKMSIPNKKPLPTLQAFIETVPRDPAPKTAVLAASKDLLNCSKDTLAVLLQESLSRGLVEIITPSNKSLPHTLRRL